MKILLIFAALILSATSLPTDLQSDVEGPSKIEDSTLFKIILDISFRLFMEEDLPTDDYDLEEQSIGKQLPEPRDIQEIFRSVKNTMKKGHDLLALIKQCQESKIFSMDCTMESAELSKSLIDDLLAYKTKFESNLENSQNFIEDQKLETQFEAEIKILQNIIDGSEIIKNAIASNKRHFEDIPKLLYRPS